MAIMTGTIMFADAVLEQVSLMMMAIYMEASVIPHVEVVPIRASSLVPMTSASWSKTSDHRAPDRRRRAEAFPSRSSSLFHGEGELALFPVNRQKEQQRGAEHGTTLSGMN
jgi:hypothetical protein